MENYFLTQESYIQRVVKRFSINESNPIGLPLSVCVNISTNHSPKTKDKFNRMGNVPYINAVDSVIYVMVYSKPDIAFATSVLRRFMSDPGELHLEAMKYLIRYLKGNKKLGLMFKTDKNGFGSHEIFN